MSISDVANRFVTDPDFISTFDFKAPQTSILLGQVQSGKTGHYLGIAAAVADKEARFPVFILLTQNSVTLQQQTFEAAKQLLTTFQVFDEDDEMEFRDSLKYSRPKMIVIKKHVSPLTKWSEILANRDILGGKSVFVIDDEADATGLNTRINQDDQSSVNRLLEKIINDNNGFLLQVTATPQAILLQKAESLFKPKSHLCFYPGPSYLGAQFFYPSDSTTQERASYTYEATADDELEILQDPAKTDLPKGAIDAIHVFLLTAAYRMGTERDSQCNFLIHPSAKTIDHETIYKKVDRYVRSLMDDIDNPEVIKNFEPAYRNLVRTKPQLPPLEKLLKEVRRTAVRITVMNSGAGNESRSLPRSGANIFIGGNVLSRGIVIPRLQTIYYCRTVKRLTSDTYWQHSRAFGYDRDETLVRLFMPHQLYSKFIQLSDDNEILFDQAANRRTSEIQVVTGKGINPTRASVVENLAGDLLVGGRHHFPISPNQSNQQLLDALLSDYDGSSYNMIDNRFGIELLKGCGEEELGDKPVIHFERALREYLPNQEMVLIVRRDRDIQKDTGTLLSPNDRKLADSFKGDSVLILYRLNGRREQGWEGNPFWVPDIKLPLGKNIYFKE
jgi:hypothetical protein